MHELRQYFGLHNTLTRPSMPSVVVDHVTFDQRLEVVLKIGDWNIEPVQIPLKPRQEQVAATVQVVITVQDATIVRNQELGDCRNHTFACEATGSAQKQDGGAHFLIFRQSHSTGPFSRSKIQSD